jgi:microcompartment protein CcmL/EutN
MNPKPDFLEILPGKRHNIEEQQQQQQQQTVTQKTEKTEERQQAPFRGLEADILARDICHGAEVRKP